MIRPSLEETRKIAESGSYNIIPLSAEIYADIKTPVEVLRILKNVSSHCFMLESMADTERWGRYTFLGFEPTLELTCANGKVTVSAGTKTVIETNPNLVIQKILDENKSPRFDYLPPFTGGLVGYFSYDYIKYSEPSLNLDADDIEGFNDADLMLFDKVIAFDNLRQKIIIIVNIKTKNFEAEYARGEKELNNIINLVKTGSPCPLSPPRILSDFKMLFDKAQYCEMVNKAKHYIKEGDIFQVVLSNRAEADFEGSLLDTYRVLRTSNPSPYMFYFGSNDLEIGGASPETLVKLENSRLYTFPLAGTRPRGETPEKDALLEEELLRDEKELAEHNMLVDLGRNDLGKISKFGTVKVEKYMSILRFSHVMHIGSTVSSEILAGKKGIDAIDAVLPAGTLSGAPKIRAMQIINELEKDRRGIYGGAVGYLDFTGNMDTCIAIRIAYKKNGKVFVRSGAGIVADSVPESEYEECINKSKAVINALRQSEGGI
ncbi:MAG: anthranilate synthase component I family protein [Spirochaetia bacterium]|jgi:anthranilate synthase component 1|nr:anthranilate synthase component I family protein [Spirochaetia bacterium]